MRSSPHRPRCRRAPTIASLTAPWSSRRSGRVTAHGERTCVSFASQSPRGRVTRVTTTTRNGSKAADPTWPTDHRTRTLTRRRRPAISRPARDRDQSGPGPDRTPRGTPPRRAHAARRPANGSPRSNPAQFCGDPPAPVRDGGRNRCIRLRPRVSSRPAGRRCLRGRRCAVARRTSRS
jgi:hypothetical protein